MDAWVIWLALFLLLLVVEVLVVDLLFLMFAGGALAAVLAALLGAPVLIQVVVFGVVSALLVAVIRPWALRTFRRETPETATNVAALIGRSATVLEPTSSLAGRVKLAGEVWTARFEGAGTLPEGAQVEVVRIDGATAVVMPSKSADLPDPANPYGTPTL
ncbi:MAG TPA: hypothetical protein DHV14_03490 [Micrococcales bacterium]|uniref:NfeD family protein n=1 Tax=Miniimonas arenae TaxID=676201 RepID=UPI000ED20741|nr:NfeD family protein [Miniimonas arenae]HCX84203.1 hypothetical protein [Micrococcales bacterium]